MGCGLSKEQAAQSQPPPAAASTATHGGAKVVHGLEAILKQADSAVDRSSMNKLYDQLYAGIFLNNRSKKYWVDKKSNSNCFMLFPRALSITWGEDSRYWNWKPLEESSNAIEGIELVAVCWLEINGKMQTSELSPGTLYEAAFVIMMKDAAYGWEIPVNIKLKKPDGSKQERKEDLKERPRLRWIEIPIGDFMVRDGDDGGEIEFSMYEHGGHWKNGMLLRGVVIRTKGSV